MTDINSTVIVVGGGVIGPTIALLLQQKGYRPIIVEKVREIGASGLSIAIHSNGLKVLNKAGVAKELLVGVTPWQNWNEYNATGEFLGGPASKLIGTCTEKFGWPCVGMSRTRLQMTLREAAIRNGIEFLQGWKLKEIQETESSVIVRAEDGREIEAGFVLGCDGLKSVTRQILLEKKRVEVKEPDFTGIAVMGGLSPTPPFLQDANTGAHIFYGGQNCMISHVIEDGMSVWAYHWPEKSAISEGWKTLPQSEIPTKVKELLDQFDGWAEPIKQMIRSTQKLMTIGIYDRPEMPVENWFEGRCMLLGDAAHPSTPHIGQGANQGLEDCWHLYRLMPDYDQSPISRERLEHIFREVATIRLPVTTALVKEARTQGGLRVVTGGKEAEEQRDKIVRERWQDTEPVAVAYDKMYNEPFRDQGGYERLMLETSS